VPLNTLGYQDAHAHAHGYEDEDAYEHEADRHRLAKELGTAPKSAPEGEF
jgi:hypothetical protein